MNEEPNVLFIVDELNCAETTIGTPRDLCRDIEIECREYMLNNEGYFYTGDVIEWMEALEFLRDLGNTEDLYAITRDDCRYCHLYKVELKEIDR